MFYRKISKTIENHLTSDDNRIMLIDGARQIGKTFIIRHVGKELFKNYVEINLLEDLDSEKQFAQINDIDEFYMQLSIAAEGKLGNKKDTLIFLDEIQAYPQLLTLLKFLREDGKYTYIASGSLLGVALKKTVSIPMGSIKEVHMYPMDFEEFLLANGISSDVIEKIKNAFTNKETLPEGVHNTMLKLFKYYLICGGLPDAVKMFIEKQNIVQVRELQLETHNYYGIDASQYDKDNGLKIRAIYDLIPSFMENKKKRIVAKEISSKKGETFARYQDEFEYLITSGISNEVRAVPTPVFPLTQGMEKNLLKLYLNDVGILTAILYGNNINSIIQDERSINLGSVYETAVASELKAHGYDLFYYDNRKKGEVDFLINDYEGQGVLPIEIKSGKDYSLHAALDKFIANEDYPVKKAFVFSNEREIRAEGSITYFPIYMIMFLDKHDSGLGEIERISNINWE